MNTALLWRGRVLTRHSVAPDMPNYKNQATLFLVVPRRCY
jgi:hypothetical protein